MITRELLRDKGILIVTPHDKLESSDFVSLASELDPYIEESGELKGLMIYTESFPGWSDFGALCSHLKFVKGHHRRIKKIAAVTDSKFMTIAPKIAEHFTSAEIKHFDYPERDTALAWLES